MSELLKLFAKLDIFSRTSLISVIVLMPFFYLSIFIVDKNLYINTDIVLRVIISFCFSTIFYFAQVLLLIVDRSILKIENNTEGCFKMAGSSALLFLLVGMVLPSGTSYRHFIIYTFIQMTIVSVVITAGDYYFSRKRIKSDKTEP